MSFEAQFGRRSARTFDFHPGIGLCGLAALAGDRSPAPSQRQRDSSRSICARHSSHADLRRCGRMGDGAKLGPCHGPARMEDMVVFRSCFEKPGRTPRLRTRGGGPLPLSQAQFRRMTRLYRTSDSLSSAARKKEATRRFIPLEHRSSPRFLGAKFPNLAPRKADRLHARGPVGDCA